jgi:hypothetical protein
MANPDPRPSGRTAIDWEQAFGFYAALPASERSYQAVGAEFGVSPRTVEAHGRNGKWKQRLREIDARTATVTEELLVRARVDELQKIRRLIEASFISYAERLRDGEIRMTPADLERLNRLSLALIDEIAQPPQPAAHEHPAAAQRTPEHTAAVVQSLAETGVLEALGLTTTTMSEQPGEKDAE